MDERYAMQRGWNRFAIWCGRRWVSTALRVVASPTTATRLLVVVVVDVREDVVAPLDGGGPGLVDAMIFDLVVEAREAGGVGVRPLHRLGPHRPRLHDERPVAGLREEQFAGGLLEAALREMVTVLEVAREFGHALRGHVQVRIDPGIGTFEPDLPVTLVAPAGGARLRDLLGREPAQILGRRGELEYVLVERDLAHEKVDEVGAFEPPVAVQLRVVWGDDQRRAFHDAEEMLDLFFAIEHEVAGVRRGFLHRVVAVVRFLVRGLARDAEILHAGETADAVGVNVRLDVVVFEVETNVTVEIAIIAVAGVAFLGTPDLLRGFDVAPERGHTRRREHRRVNPVARTRMAEHDAMRVHDEPADLGFLEKLFDAGLVGAFRQPHAARVATETLAIVVAGDHDLSANRFGMLRHQGQKAVRRAACDDLELAHLLNLAEGADEVAPIAVAERGAGLLKTVVVEPSEIVEGPVPFRAFDFLFGEFNEPRDVADVTLLQQGIEEHRA